MVYIIKTGEFEISKKFKKEEQKQYDMSKMLGPKKFQGNLENAEDLGGV